MYNNLNTRRENEKLKTENKILRSHFSGCINFLDVDMKGGHRVVNTLADLYLIPSVLRKDGMVVTVVSEGYKDYQLKVRLGSSICDNTNWGLAIDESTQESLNNKLDKPVSDLVGDQGKIVIYDPATESTYMLDLETFLSQTGVLSKDVVSDVTEGNIKAGDLLPKGMTFQEFVEKFLIKIFYPELIDPTMNMSAGVDVEVGTPTKLITITYNPGNIKGKTNSAGVWEPNTSQGPRGGAAVVYVINGEVVPSNSKVINKTTVLGENSVSGDVRYSEGQQPLDSKLNPYDEPKKSEILYGTAKWKGFFFRYAGSVGIVPTGAAIRNLTEKRNSGGVIRLNTGTVNRNFVVFVPEGSTLVSAFDETSSNVDVRHLYLDKGIVNATDAGGNTVRYRLFQMTIDNTNTKNTIHVLTVT